MMHFTVYCRARVSVLSWDLRVQLDVLFSSNKSFIHSFITRVDLRMDNAIFMPINCHRDLILLKWFSHLLCVDSFIRLYLQ